MTEAEMDSFVLVYSGGHHDVWCDGEVHMRTTGGFVWPPEFPPKWKLGRFFRCDCDRYRRGP